MQSPYILDPTVIFNLHTFLELAFRLPITWPAPDILAAEEFRSVGTGELTALGLRLIELSPSEVDELAAYCGPRAVSRNELSALLLARRPDCPLATDDGRLRKLALRSGIRVRGTLWVLDNLVDDGFLAPRRAASGLHEMLRLGARLPGLECRARMREWTSSGIPG